MIPGDSKHPARKIVIKLRSGEPLPHGASIPQQCDPKHIFPNQIIMRIFEQPKVCLPSGAKIDGRPTYPETEEALEGSWNEISQQFIFLYPGGSGLRVEQFLKIDDFMKINRRQESPFLPYWFKDKTQGFIPKFQGGWSGPIISYYGRLDTKMRKYW